MQRRAFFGHFVAGLAGLAGFLGPAASRIAHGSSVRPAGAVVSVLDHGAVGDGMTSDRVAIQSAVDAVGKLGGGTVFFPYGDYPVALSLSVPGVSLQCDPGTILRPSGTGAVLDVAAGAENTFVGAFDIRGMFKANEARRRPGEAIKANASYCLRIAAKNFTADGVTTRGARFDGIYIRHAGNGDSNITIQNFFADASARNSVSVVAGRNIKLISGKVRQSNEFKSPTPQSGGYLFDQEPNGYKDKFSGATFTHVDFIAAGTIADNCQVIFHKTNMDEYNRLDVKFKNCRFLKGGAATTPASIRLANPTAMSFEGLHIEDCYFEGRAFSSIGRVFLLRNSSLRNIVTDSKALTFNVQLGDDCILDNVRSTAGALSLHGGIYKQGATK